MSEFFRAILTNEIDSIPRRAISFAKEKVLTEDEQQLSHRDFYDLIKNFLRKKYEIDLKTFESLNSSSNSNLILSFIMYYKNYNKYLIYFIVCYILFCYDPPVDRNLEGKVIKKHIKSYWKNYKETLKLLLIDVNLFLLNRSFHSLKYKKLKTKFLRLIIMKLKTI